MHDHVGAPLHRPEQVRRGEGIVDHQHDVVLLGDRRDLLEREHGDVRVAQRLAVDDLGILADRLRKVLRLRRIDKSDLDAEVTERMVELVVSAAVETAAGDDVIARVAERENRLRLRGMAGARCQARDPALERGDTLLEHVGGGVHQSRVDVAQLLECEQVRGMLGAAELIAGSLVDGYCAASRGRIRRLAGVQLLRGETVFARLSGHRSSCNSGAATAAYLDNNRLTLEADNIPGRRCMPRSSVSVSRSLYPCRRRLPPGQRAYVHMAAAHRSQYRCPPGN